MTIRHSRNTVPALLSSALLTLSAAASARGGHGHDKGQWLETMDADRDGVVTASEVQASQLSLFARADADRNGALTPAEFETGWAQTQREHLLSRISKFDSNKDKQLSTDEAQSFGIGDKRFAVVDTNGDKQLSADELAQGLRHHRGNHRAERFTSLDRNADGKLSAEETPMNPKQFARIDANGDGAVSVEEFGSERKGPATVFQRLDDNADGALSKGEVEAAAKRLVARLDRNQDGRIDAGERESHGRKGKHHGKGGPMTQEATPAK